MSTSMQSSWSKPPKQHPAINLKFNGRSTLSAAATAYDRFTLQADECVGTNLGALAGAVARRPRLVAVLSVLAALLSTLGMTQLELVTEGADLWVPRDSVAFAARTYTEDHYPSVRQEDIVLTVAPDTPEATVASVAYFDALWAVHAATVAIPDYDALCSPKPGTPGWCMATGPLERWAFNHTLYDASVATDADVLEALRSDTLPGGAPASDHSIVFGTGVVTDGDGKFVSAKGSATSFFIRDVGARSMAWELQWLEAMGISGAPTAPASAQVFPGAIVHVQSMRSLDDEITRVVALDVPLMGLT